jgi:uncharacterized OsmC-like protein
MEWMDKIRTAFERNAKALNLRPSLGLGTAVTAVRMRDGLTLDVEEGPWKFTVDMGTKSGGNNAGPNPGVLARGALGTCLAVSYILWAARRALPLRSLEVEVQTDYDARGYHGAPEAEVMRVLDEADAHCDNLFLFADEQKITRQVQLNTPER